MAAIGLLILGNATLANAQVFAPARGQAENVEWKREGTTFTVTYDLTSSDPSAVFKVTLKVSIAGAPFQPVAVTGDIGDKVSPGRRKTIVWKTTQDTDSQDYDLFKFDVDAVSGRLAPVGGPPATAKPMSDLRGTWVGNYANSATAELVVDRQDGVNFAGTLRLAMKAGDELTELRVEGSLSALAVDIREVTVLRPGKVKNWNLGSGSGSLEADGQQMAGRGKDRRTDYTWLFIRLSTAAGSAPVPAQSQRAVQIPASADISGSWVGTYGGSPAELSLTRAEGSTFQGTLKVTTNRGKEPTQLAVELVVTGGTIVLREARVVANGAVSTWNLGSATGVLQSDSRQMSGSGRDSRSTFKWSFKRMSPLLHFE